MKFLMFSRAIHAEVTGVDQHQQNGVAERCQIHIRLLLFHASEMFL